MTTSGGPSIEKIALCPTFIVSSKITHETVKRLNNAYTDCVFPPEFHFFVPVPKDITTFSTPGQAYTIEVTEASEERVQQMKEQIEHNGQRQSHMYGILNDRSIEDETVVLHYTYWASTPPTGDNPEEQIKYRDRLRFADAYPMCEHFDIGTMYGTMTDDFVMPRREARTVNGILEIGRPNDLD